MPQNGAYENHNLMDEDGQASVLFLLQGSSKFDSVDDGTNERALERRELCRNYILRT
jgi:hypothetical protein